MKALLDPDAPQLQKMPTVASWLRNAESARRVVAATHPDIDDAARIQALVLQNVRTQLAHLRTHPSVAARIAMDQITLHGWVYQIETGEVQSVDEVTGAVSPLGQPSLPHRAA